MIAPSCQKLAGCRLEQSRVDAPYEKPPGSVETDVSEYQANAVSMRRVGRQTVKGKDK